ncbi:hypothetical protein B0H15DRAFT_289904 [Mycena belliarum]|uniref:F-box domain-containing protein n=1 Tax=Mycena belliarum TaxID=1033014 RepID=A0AAD6U7W5_9AGAR|nr:hypothetical protein B0H15DRAFT_289904 [Mycena belliae]
MMLPEVIRDLQDRIDAVSADIERNREIQRNLEHIKAALHREINALRDPVARLPFELSSDIFIRCLPSSPTARPQEAPMLLLNICSAWKHIALDTPALWTCILIDHICTKEYVEGWATRAQGHPLSVVIRGTLDEGLVSVVQQYTEELRSLELQICGDEYASPAFITSLGPLPSLEALTICNRDGRYLIVGHSYVLAALRLAPNLTACTFLDLETHLDTDTPVDTLVLRRLRSLEFNDECQALRILEHLSLPALEALSLPMLVKVSPDSHLMSFLHRSSPPLQKLNIGYDEESDYTAMEDLLRLLPGLTQLELNWSYNDYLPSLFTTLTKSRSTFLPLLQHLKITNYTLSTAAGEVIHRALSARRTQLKSFELITTQAF